jgi:hypothetical protein
MTSLLSDEDAAVEHRGEKESPSAQVLSSWDVRFALLLANESFDEAARVVDSVQGHMDSQAVGDAFAMLAESCLKSDRFNEACRFIHKAFLEYEKKQCC